VISGTAKTDTELRKDLSRLHTACRTIVDILDADMSRLRQIEVMLSVPWRGSQIPRVVEELLSLSSRIDITLAMAEQNGAIRKRQQDPASVPMCSYLRHYRTRGSNRCDNRSRLIDQGLNDDGHHPGTLHVQYVGSTWREVDDASAGVWAAVVDFDDDKRLLSTFVTFA
jgi:hypothetical protein